MAREEVVDPLQKVVPCPARRLVGSAESSSILGAPEAGLTPPEPEPQLEAPEPEKERAPAPLPQAHSGRLSFSWVCIGPGRETRGARGAGGRARASQSKWAVAEPAAAVTCTACAQHRLEPCPNSADP